MIKNKEIIFFIIIGFCTVAVDYSSYIILLYYITGEELYSKTLSFVAGTIFSYIMNRSLTFNFKGRQIRSVLRFCLVYSSTMVMNVGINYFLLSLLIDHPYKVTIAYLSATSVSATLNFTGMKYFVFKKK